MLVDGDLRRGGYELGQDGLDDLPQCVPATGHGELADPEDLGGDLLHEVLAQQRQHHRHGTEQPQRERPAPGHILPTEPRSNAHHQLGELLRIQTCRNLKPQRSLRYVKYSCKNTSRYSVETVAPWTDTPNPPYNSGKIFKNPSGGL